MTDYQHTIVVGGTGMLETASVELARRSESITSIARTGASLRALDAKITDPGCRHRIISQDYNHLAGLRSAICEAMDAGGPSDLLVAWIHDQDGPVPTLLCECVSSLERPCRVVHVMGSVAADPTRSLEAGVAHLSEIPGVDYQPVVLGFVIDGEDGGARWLTDREISKGVLEAIEGEAAPFVVGQVRPWSRRP